MKLCISTFLAILILTNLALGGVGDSGVSDGASYSSASGSSGDYGYSSTGTGSAVTGYASETGSSLLAEPSSASGLVTGYQVASPNGYSSDGYSSDGYSSGGYGSSQHGSDGYVEPAYSQGQQVQEQPASVQASSTLPDTVPEAPDASSPYQEKLTPQDLNLQQPTAESFQPDTSLNFASAAPPSGVSYSTTSSYWPGYSTTMNRLYVQTSGGFSNVAGCAYGGYLPIWTDIAYSGNLYLYEWYPGQWTPSVRWWGWTWPGFKKAWFCGDVTGWHVLAYNCKDWSNYVYVYVWPSSGSGYSPGYSQSGYSQGDYSYPQTSQVQSSQVQSSQLPSGTPTYPNLNSEKIVLPEVSQVPQVVSGTGNQASSSGASSQASSATSSQVIYQYQSYQYQGQQSSESEAASSASSALATPVTAVPGYEGQTGYVVPGKSSGQSCKGADCMVQSGYQAVYPSTVVQKCNQYYIQTCPGQLSTVARTNCGDYLCLWSKIGSCGTYWSFEWYACGTYPSGYYCSPEVKNFGKKSAGWTQTWFRANRPGWHVLAFCCNDWSNYVYVYVYPSS